MKKITLLLLFLFISLNGYSQLYGLTEGFDNMPAQTGALPEVWTSPDTGDWAIFENNNPTTIGSGESWGINAFAAGLYHSSPQCASVDREQINLGNKSEDYLATSVISVPATGLTELHFWTRMITSGDQGTIFKVMVAPALDPSFQTDPTAYLDLQQWTELNLIVSPTDFNVWTEKTVNLSAYAGLDIYVAFVKVFSFTDPSGNNGGDSWLIDDVGVFSQCTAPTTLTIPSTTSTTANLTWANPSGATTWEIQVIPSFGAPITYPQYSGALPFVATGLTSDTTYTYQVKAICGTGFSSPWSTASANFTTLLAPPECGGDFVDSGGSTGQYAINSNVTSTICPTNPGDVVTVTFTAFNTEATFDALYVYSGNAVVPADLIPSSNAAGNVPGGLAGGYWGTTIPCPFTSSATNGCLTFVFRSNGSGQRDGWIANITCAPPPPCRQPTAITTNTLTFNSVTLNWSQPANLDTSVASAWQVLALPCGSPAPTVAATGYIDVTTPPPYNLTGLTPATCYDVYVRANCGLTTSEWPCTPKTITTLAAPPICGGNFIDEGGTANPYAADSNVTRTICPTNLGEVVTVTFTSFDTEANWDALYVYNGNAVDPANLIPSNNGAGSVPGGLAGGYWGTTIPCPFTSSATNGCLTFVFRSDGIIQNAGWVSNITCGPPPPCRIPNAITTNTVTHNSVILNWTQPTNPNASVASAWQVLALPCGSAAPTAAATGYIDVTTPPPYTLTGLNPTTCYDIYVRANCGSATSAWPCSPKTITTLIAPPVCGGLFVDAGGPTGLYANSSNIPTTICPTNPGDVVTVTFTEFNTEATWDGLYVYDGNSVNPATLLPTTNGAGNVPIGLPGSYWGLLTGGALPGPFTATNPSGCLTFVFSSDGSGQRDGWNSTVTCAPPPTCLKPNALTVSNVTSTSALLGWSDTNIVPASQWEVLVLPFGSPAPLPTAVGIIVYSNPALITGLNPATKYTFYVRAVCSTIDHSAWSSGSDFLTLIINDECTGAIFAPVNSSSVCQQITSASIAGATASAGAIAPCLGTADDDSWFQFVATNPFLTVSLLNVQGSTTNLNFAVYSGSCGALTRIFCSAANTVTGIVNGLTIGQTYYLRVYSNASTPQTSTFDLCISTPASCLTSQTACQNLSYQNTTGIASQGTIGCLNSSPNPTYYTINIQQNGPINLLLTQSTTQGGTPNLDVDYAAWGPFTDSAAACSAIGNPPTLAPGIGVPISITTGCSYSARPIENLDIVNALAGQVYVILITNFSDDPGYVSLTQTNSTAPGAGVYFCCPNAYFTYSPVSYCKQAGTSNPIAVITAGSQAGEFSSTLNPGLVFTNTATGEVDLAASAPGNYLITNTVAASGSCLAKSQSYSISIVEPTSASIEYGSPTYCQSITTLQPVTQTGTTGGSYSAIPNVGLSINPTTGKINPSLSSPGLYTVVYGLPGSICTVSNPSAQVEILALPNIVQPAPVVACYSTLLPALTVGDYYSQSQLTGAGTTSLDISVPITASQDIYVYALSANGCSNEKSFNVTINTVPTPTFPFPTPSACGTPTGALTVLTPTGSTAPIPGNLFISEVTDSAAGSLTYVEIYNGTGASVNLANYKLRFYTSVAGAPSCDLTLSGILANNSTNIIKVSSDPNITGVVPNQTFTLCSGVNYNDNIRLTTSTNTLIDLWGRIDGVTFTPNNQAGYTYRRLSSATLPSTTWNPADWTAIDPENYSNLGSYSLATSNYQYSIDNGVTYQAGLTFNNLAAGDYILIVKDLITGCLSIPVPVTIGFGSIVTGFSYPDIVCQNGANPFPGNFDTGFTTGGTYSEDTTVSTGLVFVSTSSGEIDLINSTPGIHSIIYTVLPTPSCLASGESSATIEIKPVITPVIGFTYPATICKNAQTTLTPTLAPDFSTFATFSATPPGLAINPSTGVIDLANSIAGVYSIVVNVPEDSSSSVCRVAASTSPAVSLEIKPVITLATGFSYDSPFCAATGSESPLPGLGFTSGGIYSSTPGLIINASTGVIDLSSSPGTYTVTYTVTPNAGNCEVSTPGTAQVMIIPPITIELTGGCQSVNYILTANPINGSFVPETATYSWQNDAGIEVGTTQSITVTEVDNYTVTITVDGCSTESESFNVTTVSCVIQKGISVNNDGLNDTFDLSGYDVKKLTIFNRLGMKVYSRNNYVDEWGGKSDDGDELPDGTYYYVIDRNNGDPKTGWIYINRAQ